MRFLLLKFGDLFFCSVTTSRLAIRFNDHTIQEQENFVGYKLQNFIGKKKNYSNFILKFVILADFGGLLGLFMGCSLLSIVELIFYCCAACFKRKDNGKINLKNMSKEEFDRLQ